MADSTSSIQDRYDYGISIGMPAMVLREHLGLGEFAPDATAPVNENASVHKCELHPARPAAQKSSLAQLRAAMDSENAAMDSKNATPAVTPVDPTKQYETEQRTRHEADEAAFHAHIRLTAGLYCPVCGVSVIGSIASVDAAPPVVAPCEPTAADMPHVPVDGVVIIPSRTRTGHEHSITMREGLAVACTCEAGRFDRRCWAQNMADDAIESERIYLIDQGSEEAGHIIAGGADAPAERLSAIEAALLVPIDRQWVATREGPHGAPIDYIPAHVAIAAANRIFGPFGWSTEIMHGPAVVSGVLSYAARVRITVHGCPDPIVREDVGMCDIRIPRDGKAPGSAEHETALKGCVSDAIKRALRQFGPALGLDINGPVPCGPDDAKTFQSNAPAPAPAQLEASTTEMVNRETGELFTGAPPMPAAQLAALETGHGRGRHSDHPVAICPLCPDVA